jgi:hypothetical protein
MLGESARRAACWVGSVGLDGSSRRRFSVTGRSGLTDVLMGPEVVVDAWVGWWWLGV